MKTETINPEVFEVSGIQKVGKEYYFYRLRIENGEIKQIVEKRGPDVLATAIERVKLNNVNTILNVGGY
jgi:hypothetical protein